MHNVIFAEQPLVSVVIPTYNRSVHVMEAIASVLAQTYSRWELIVADDGSGDDTVQKILSLTDPRIRVLTLPHSGNVAMVRNAGAAAGSGAWIAFLDSDDLWIPRKLEIQVNLLQQTGKRWTYGGYLLMNDQGQEVPFKAGSYKPFSGWIVAALLTTEASVNMGTLVIERALFNELCGFDTKPYLNYREDYEFALRLALRAEAIASTELLLRIREHSGRGGNADDQGNARTASVYKHFIRIHSARTTSGKELVRIARRQLAYHLAEAAVRDMKKARYWRALRGYGQALQAGDGWRHLLSALRRGISPQAADNH